MSPRVPAEPFGWLLLAAQRAKSRDEASGGRSLDALMLEWVHKGGYSQQDVDLVRHCVEEQARRERDEA